MYMSYKIVLFPDSNPIILRNKGNTYEYGPQVRLKGYPPNQFASHNPLDLLSQISSQAMLPPEGEANVWRFPKCWW